MDGDLQAISNIWAPSYATPLTAEDAREIRDNVLGFFKVLDDWQKQDGLALAAPDEQV